MYVTSTHGFVGLVTWAFSIIVTTVVVLKKLFPDLFKSSNGPEDLVVEINTELDEEEVLEDLPPGNE